MPRCEVDSLLQDDVRRFVKESGLTVNGVATLLAVNRTTFWRFHETGEALTSTRARIREALANRIKRTEGGVADGAVHQVDRGASMRLERARLQGSLTGRELRQIRKACEGVLMLLNVYEAQQPLVRKLEDA